MTATLSPEQYAQYQRDGYLFPIDCLTPEEVRHYRTRLEDFERAQGDTFGRLPDLVRSKSHLLFTWMDALVRHPKVLDAVESVIGPNILIYHLTSWLKEPNEPSHVSWHQDGTYFGLDPADQVTAWIALTDSTPEMGCIKLLPGTHVIGQKPHDDTQIPGNLLSRGQTIRHKLPPGAQKSEFLLERGMVDCIVKRTELKARLSFFLEFFSDHLRKALAEKIPNPLKELLVIANRTHV